MKRSGGSADRRRLLRFVSAAGLACILALAAGQSGPDWLTLTLTVAGALGSMWLGLRRRHTAILAKAGRLALLAGMGIMLVGTAAAQFGRHDAAIARLCPGQSAAMAGWNLKLAEIMPVAAEGYTAIEAEFIAAPAAGAPIRRKPQLRQLFATGEAAAADATASLWRGDLRLAVTRFDPASGCIALDASWRPFAGAARLGGWLAALGAALIALAALRALHWRVGARERIAMRREERPLPGARAALPAPHRWLLPAVVLASACAALLVFAVPALRPAAQPPTPPYGEGNRLVVARQSLLEGPANTNRWIVIGDAMARRGQFASAAEVLLGAVEADPRDVDGWLALGDALYGHAGGHMTPAASLAYDRADRAAALRGISEPVARTMERSGRGDLAAAWRSRQAAR